MSDLDRQLAEDRRLRDAAKAMLMADVEHLKTGMSGKAIAERTVGRIATGAKDALDQAVDVADSNRGALAALIGAIVLWCARHPILEAIGLEIERHFGEAEAEGEETATEQAELPKNENPEVSSDAATIPLETYSGAEND